MPPLPGHVTSSAHLPVFNCCQCSFSQFPQGRGRIQSHSLCYTGGPPVYSSPRPEKGKSRAREEQMWKASPLWITWTAHRVTVPSWGVFPRLNPPLLFPYNRRDLCYLIHSSTVILTSELLALEMLLVPRVNAGFLTLLLLIVDRACTPASL